jgi:hypothetical protein
MPTELSTSGLSLSLDLEPMGRPIDNGLYNESASQLFWYGKRLMTMDGRVFKYSGSKTALLSSYGAFNYTDIATQNGAVLPYATLAGDSKIRITIANTNGYGGGAIAKDELVGGYVEIQETSKPAVTRMIVANDYVSTSGGVIYVTLDGPLVSAYSTSAWCDMILNPYAYLGKGNLNFNAVMGVPTIDRTIDYNGWVQTWGPCYVVGGGGHAFGASANDRTMYFVGDGSVNAGLYLTVESGYQVAGFIIDSTATVAGASAASGVPLLMLQISI